MEKHRKQIRLLHFDYGNTGTYYVTICTHERKRFLSTVENGKVTLTNFGTIVLEELLKTINMRTYVSLDDFVIMPNHLHVILFFHERAAEHLPEKQDSPIRNFGGSEQHSLSSVVANFKAAVTNRIRKETGKEKAIIWQRGFYEHIIRDEKDLMRIRDYITTNPLNWSIDEENPDYKPQFVGAHGSVPTELRKS